MNIGTRLLVSAALAAGSTIGAAALGNARDASLEVAAQTASAAPAGDADSEARAQGVRAELLSAAEAGEISWEAAQRVSEDLGSYILGARDASALR